MFDRIAFWSEALHSEREKKLWERSRFVIKIVCFCLQLFLQQRSRLNATFAAITFCMSSGRIIMAGHRSCCCHCYYNKWTERNRKKTILPLLSRRKLHSDKILIQGRNFGHFEACCCCFDKNHHQPCQQLFKCCCSFFATNIVKNHYNLRGKCDWNNMPSVDDVGVIGLVHWMKICCYQNVVVVGSLKRQSCHKKWLIAVVFT